MTDREIKHLLAWLEQNEPDYPRNMNWWVDLRAWAVARGYEPEGEEDASTEDG